MSMSTSTPYQDVLFALLSYPHVFTSPPNSPHKLLIPQTSAAQLPTISSLSLHPVLESLLHILNADLSSAHFLCRHAEVAPKWESMYVHGILHRIEGDIDNTRAWYGNVSDSEVFQWVWEGGHRNDEGNSSLSTSTTSTNNHDKTEDIPSIARQGWKHFLSRLQRYRDRTTKRKHLHTRPEQDNRNHHASTPANSHLDQSEITNWAEEETALRTTSLWEIKRVLSFCENKFGTEMCVDAKGEFLGRIESGDERLAAIAQGMVTGGEGWRVF